MPNLFFKAIRFLDCCNRYGYRLPVLGNKKEHHISFSYCGLQVNCIDNYKFKIWVRSERLPIDATWLMGQWWDYQSITGLSIPIMRFSLYEQDENTDFSRLGTWRAMGISYVVPL